MGNWPQVLYRFRGFSYRTEGQSPRGKRPNFYAVFASFPSYGSTVEWGKPAQALRQFREFSYRREGLSHGGTGTIKSVVYASKLWCQAQECSRDAHTHLELHPQQPEPSQRSKMSRLKGQHLREGSGRGGVQRQSQAMKHCCGIDTFANYVARNVSPSTCRPATAVRCSRTVCSRVLRTSLTAHRLALYPLSIAFHYTKKTGNVTKYSRHKDQRIRPTT